MRRVIAVHDNSYSNRLSAKPRAASVEMLRARTPESSPELSAVCTPAFQSLFRDAGHSLSSYFEVTVAR
jgi:hypothetical protein